MSRSWRTRCQDAGCASLEWEFQSLLWRGSLFAIAQARRRARLPPSVYLLDSYWRTTEHSIGDGIWSYAGSSLKAIAFGLVEANLEGEVSYSRWQDAGSKKLGMSRTGGKQKNDDRKMKKREVSRPSILQLSPLSMPTHDETVSRDHNLAGCGSPFGLVRRTFFTEPRSDLGSSALRSPKKNVRMFKPSVAVAIGIPFEHVRGHGSRHTRAGIRLCQQSVQHKTGIAVQLDSKKSSRQILLLTVSQRYF